MVPYSYIPTPLPLPPQQTFAKYGEITSAVLRKADEPDDSKAHEDDEEEEAAAKGEGKEGEKEGADKKEKEGAAKEGESKQGDDKAAGAAEGKKPTHRGFGFVNFAEVRSSFFLVLCACIVDRAPTPTRPNREPQPGPLFICTHKPPTLIIARVGQEGDGGAERAEVPRRGPGREGALRPPPPDQEGAPEGTFFGGGVLVRCSDCLLYLIGRL